MSTKRKSGFANDAAEKIWNDHLGNNVYTRHRDSCETCSKAYVQRGAAHDARAGTPETMQQYQQAAEAISKRYPDCAEGVRIFHEMLSEIDDQIQEACVNQN